MDYEIGKTACMAWSVNEFSVFSALLRQEQANESLSGKESDLAGGVEKSGPAALESYSLGHEVTSRLVTDRDSREIMAGIKSCIEEVLISSDKETVKYFWRIYSGLDNRGRVARSSAMCEEYLIVSVLGEPIDRPFMLAFYIKVGRLVKKFLEGYLFSE